MKMVYAAKSPISAKTDQNPDFEQHLEFFLVLTAPNHCKRSQRGLRFVWDVLRAFLVIIRTVIFEKRAKSSKIQSEKGYKIK